MEDKPHGGGPSRELDAEDRAELRRLHEEDNDAYLHELADRLAERRGKRVGRNVIASELAEMGITRKKNTSERPSKTHPKSKPPGRNSQR